MPRKQKELNLICYSKDGTRLKIDPETGIRSTFWTTGRFANRDNQDNQFTTKRY